jgi:hypothetical protein
MTAHATWKIKAEGSQSDASHLAKGRDPNLKDKQKAKELGIWFKW